MILNPRARHWICSLGLHRWNEWDYMLLWDDEQEYECDARWCLRCGKTETRNVKEAA